MNNRSRLATTSFAPIYADAWMNGNGHGVNYGRGAERSTHYAAGVEGARNLDGADDFLIGTFDARGRLVDLTSAHGVDLTDGGWTTDSYRSVAEGLGVQWAGGERS